MVSVQRNVYVAGQAAYQLSLVPRSSKSLVGSVLIAIDAARRIPLRVEVYARALVGAGLQHRLHRADVRHARRVQLQLHAASWRDR